MLVQVIECIFVDVKEVARAAAENAVYASTGHGLMKLTLENSGASVRQIYTGETYGVAVESGELFGSDAAAIYAGWKGRRCPSWVPALDFLAADGRAP